MILLNPTVGVAPGTTTMQLGNSAGMPLYCGPNGCPPTCPPDPVRYYTDPPNVKTGPASSGSFERNTYLDGTTYVPYAEMERLRGLRGLGDVAPRWGLVLFAGLATFAGVLGYRRWQRSR